MDSFLYDSDDSALDGVSFKRIVSTAPIQVSSQDIAKETNLSFESEKREQYSPLHTSKDNCDVDEYEEVPFGEIVEKIAANNCSQTLRQQLNALHDEWKQLDEEYLKPNTDPKLNTIALPTGFDYKSLESLDDIDCHLTNCHELYNHPRYPTNTTDKKEYLSRLFHLLKSVPKTSLINDIFSSSSLQTVKLLSDQSNRHKIVNDIAMNQPEYILFDEDRLKKRRRLDTDGHINASNDSPSDSSVIYSIGLFSITSHAIQQRLQLLGHHTLAQLKDLLYCVQSEIHCSSQCDGILPLPEDQNNKGYYFFIEGGFYHDHGCIISETIVNDTKESLKAIVEKIRGETNPNTANSVDTSKAPKRKSPFESATLAAALLEKLAKNTDASNHSPAKDIKVYSRPSRKGTKQLRSFTFPTFISQSLELSPYHGTLCLSEELIFPNVPSSNNVTLDQLDLKVGVGYLFSHCGGCEHLIVVTDIREYHDALDGDDVSLYPCILSTIYGRKRKCQACESYGAAYVVFNDRLTETNPCFLCKFCYQSLHYDNTGNLLYDDFCVYPYLQDMT